MKVLIAGGGIGGLAAALSLHQAGIDCHVFERSRSIRELGVGINTLPHAIKELAELGLLQALDAAGVRTYELIYQNRHGQEIWRDLRGTHAGLEYPQFSIHRGHLQGVLYEAALKRLGPNRVHTGHELVDFTQDAAGVQATFARRDEAEGEAVIVSGDVLIAADGIHSMVRAHYYPDEGPPAWNGIMLWRGAVPWKPFLTGKSMVIAGGMAAKLVLYPIARVPGDKDKVLMNWAVGAKTGDATTPMPRREDWSREGQLSELLPFVEDQFHLDVLDPLALIKATKPFYEYPMCDRDPVAAWAFDRVVLMGDAAHPMYPVGSNGASQAILDGRCIAAHLAAGSDTRAALKAYEAERLPVCSKIVETNRSGGPERVIDLIDQRAPDGFADINDVATPNELKSIVSGYAQMAGFDKDRVNKQPAHPGAQPPSR